MKSFLKFTWGKLGLTIILSIIAFAIVFLEAFAQWGDGIPTPIPIFFKLIAPGLFISPSLAGGAWMTIFFITLVIYWYILSCIIIWLLTRGKQRRQTPPATQR